MKKFICILFFYFTPVLAHAIEDFYINVGTGGAYFSNVVKHDGTKLKVTHTVPLVNFSIGLNLTNDFRNELAFINYGTLNSREVGEHLILGVDEGKVKYNILARTKMYAVYYSMYYDIYKKNNYYLFVGAGYGLTKEKTTAKGYNFFENVMYPFNNLHKTNNTRFGAKGSLGVGYRAENSNIATELVYNYIAMTKCKNTEDKPINKYNLNSHSIICNVKYNF